MLVPGVGVVFVVRGRPPRELGRAVVYRDPHTDEARVGRIGWGLPAPGQTCVEELAEHYGPLPTTLVEGTPLLSLSARGLAWGA